MKQGDRFSCEIMGKKVTGRVQKQGGQFYLRQNEKIGWCVNSGNNKDLNYNNVNNFKIIGEITMNNSDMIELKRKVSNLSNGWDKEANEVIAQIPMDIQINISCNSGENNGSILIAPKTNISKAKEFKFESGECDKNRAFKKALNYILDLCWNEIKGSEDNQEEIEEVKENICHVEGIIDDIKHELSGINDDKKETEDELLEKRRRLDSLECKLRDLEN